MKIEEGNANKTTRIGNRFSISLILVLVIFMISGSAATMTHATPQTLPTCVDPTGQNLTCIMFISTLPPPKNTLQCQETSGQIFKCTYIVDKLSNGNKIVAITIYVPANFVFSNPTVIKVVEHETITKTTTKTKIVLVTQCSPTQKWNPVTHKCVDICPPGKYLVGNNCVPIPPITIDCLTGYHPEFVDGKWRCVPDIVPYVPPSSCDSKYYTGPCPPTDINAYTKCISAALLANDEKGQLACARLLPDTPENAYTKCISEALIKNDLKAELACAKYLPNTTPINNMTNTTTASAPSNTSIPCVSNCTTSQAPTAHTSSGPHCVDNCTTGTPPPVDCTKNPNDPSCTQTLTPPPTTPSTKTCPDGSVIDASATCPTNTPPSTPPPTSSPPPSTGSQGSPDNNPSPPSNSVPPPSSSGGDNGGSSSGSGGSSSGSGGSGGSSTSP